MSSVVPLPAQLVDSLRAFIDAAVAKAGSTKAHRPGHRVRFHWPPHPVSYDYHISPLAWSANGTFSSGGEVFEVEIAETPHGVFGRCAELWAEAKGADKASMLANMAAACEPLFTRQHAINECLMKEGRFKGHIRDLPPSDLIRLLYCQDRDVAANAASEIETHASMHIFTPALIGILDDERHPDRRIAQWCVLDLFEDLTSFCYEDAEQVTAIESIGNFIWRATDDYARAVFKAGSVLGGHITHPAAAARLIACLDGPNRIGRRSAIHGLFHVVEWNPQRRSEIVGVLRKHAEREHDALLKAFAQHMADDLEQSHFDHVPEPLFPEEA